MNKKQRVFYQHLISKKNKQDTVLATVISLAVMLSIFMAASALSGINMTGGPLKYVGIGLLALPVMIGLRVYGRIFHDTLFGKGASVYAILPVSAKDNIRIRMRASERITVIIFTDICYVVALLSVLSFAENDGEIRNGFFSKLGELVMSIRSGDLTVPYLMVLVVLLTAALTATAYCWEMGVFLGTVAANTFSEGKGGIAVTAFVFIIWILAFSGIEYLIWIPLRIEQVPDIATAITTLAIRTVACSTAYFVERRVTENLLENHYMLV